MHSRVRALAAMLIAAVIDLICVPAADALADTGSRFGAAKPTTAANAGPRAPCPSDRGVSKS